MSPARAWVRPRTCAASESNPPIETTPRAARPSDLRAVSRAEPSGVGQSDETPPHDERAEASAEGGALEPRESRLRDGWRSRGVKWAVTYGVT